MFADVHSQKFYQNFCFSSIENTMVGYRHYRIRQGTHTIELVSILLPSLLCWQHLENQELYCNLALIRIIDIDRVATHEQNILDRGCYSFDQLIKIEAWVIYKLNGSIIEIIIVSTKYTFANSGVPTFQPMTVFGSKLLQIADSAINFQIWMISNSEQRELSIQNGCKFQNLQSILQIWMFSISNQWEFSTQNVWKLRNCNSFLVTVRNLQMARDFSSPVILIQFYVSAAIDSQDEVH